LFFKPFLKSAFPCATCFEKNPGFGLGLDLVAGELDLAGAEVEAGLGLLVEGDVVLGELVEVVVFLGAVEVVVFFGGA